MASGMYPPSPAMDVIGGGGAPVGLSHQDAMDRFNVSFVRWQNRGIGKLIALCL